MTPRHFLKRDFLDFRLHWALIGLISIPMIWWLRSESFVFWVWFIIGQTYFMWGMMGTAHCFPVVQKARDRISRSYLLSLPIPRKTVFAIQHLRCVVFWLPCVLLALYCLASKRIHPDSVLEVLVFFLGIAATIGFFIESSVWMTLEEERMACYMSRAERLVGRARSYLLMVGGCLPLYYAWANMLLPSDPRYLGNSWFYRTMALCIPSLVFPIAGVLTVALTVYNARRWCVIRSN